MPRPHRFPFLLLLLLLLSGACATATGTFEPLGANHPANPKAAEAPIQDPAPFLGAEAAAPHPAPGPQAIAAGAYVCPMHADVASDEAGRCPKCGMQLVPRAAQPKEHVHGG